MKDVALAVIAGAAGVAAGALGLRLRAVAAEAARARAEAADANERRYNVLEAIPDGVYALDDALRITHINEEAERLLQSVPGPFVGRALESVLSPLGSDLVPEIRRARVTGTVETRVAHFGAIGWWIEIRILPAAKETVVYLRDVTVRKRAETRLLESESRLRMLMEQVPAVLWSVDRLGRFLSVSGAGLTALNRVPEELVGREFGAFADAPDGLALPAELFEGTPVQFESAAGTHWLRHHVEPMRDAAGQTIGAVGVSLDISELRTARERLESAARKDALTQLPNRFALEEVLAESLARPERGVSAVLFVDLDRFKTINDTLGHRVGDEVLRVISDRLRSSVDQADVVARQGGDEFIIVLRSMTSLDDVGAVAARLLRRFDEPMFVGGRQLYVKASIGAALAPLHGTTADELMKNADAAMYNAKRSGRGTFRFYDGEVENENRERLAIENDLRGAIERDEFVLQYQPIVNLATGRITGAEALVRWRHPARGMLEPDAFIRYAEEAGLIGPITSRVLAGACAFGAALRAERPDFRVSVNLSPSDLRDGRIYGTISDALERARLEPGGLEIEVTENALLDDSAIVSLEALRALGVYVAVDDFGVAYNSLLYLKRLPVTSLKIDRLFVNGLADDTFDQSIVAAIVTLGSSLGLRVIAEGIESEAQWEFVNGLGCEEAQGFRFSRPIDPADIRRLLLAPPDFRRR